MKRNSFYIGIMVVGMFFSSCDKYLDIQPVGTVVPKTEDDFRALLTSGYQTFPTHKSLLSLRTDELVLDENSTDLSSLKDIYLWNDQNPDPSTDAYPWLTFYKSIFYANHLLSEIDKEVGETTGTKQLKAEAFLLRAYAHFELLNCYAEQYNEANKAKKAIPIVTQIDMEQVFPLATVEEVFNFILSDIDKAEELVQIDEQPTATKYRFSRRALYAFKARVYLYQENWEQAFAEATKALAINNKLVDLNNEDARLPSDFESEEVIMALDKVAEPKVSTSSYIAESLLQSYDKDNDLRFVRYFQISEDKKKYSSLKSGNDQYNVSFRNGELYLVVAEALVHLQKNDQATEHLATLLKNRIRPVAVDVEIERVQKMNGEQLLSFIKAERQRELALEGLRWYDLKRGDRPQIVHQFMGKDYTLQKNDSRYVIRYPQEAIDNNPDLL